MAVLRRQFYGGGGYNSNLCTDNNGNTYYCYSQWNSWGRWVALAAILVVFFIAFFLCSLMSARRRKRQGQQPYYGTGWVGTTPWGHGRAVYNPNVRTQQADTSAPPAYGQNLNEGGNYGQNGGYLGQQQTGTEMQPPADVYNGYAAPAGPPPGKGDGIIR